MLKKVVAFMDGENLVGRFQDMVTLGATPKSDVVHDQDSFVWHNDMTRWSDLDVIRVSYYTSVVGDEAKVAAVESKIGSTYFECRSANMIGRAKLIPRVHKKAAKSNKTKVVDVDITMDVMRATLTMPVDAIFLASGDRDYLPLLREVAKSSKQVYLAAFSSGLGSGLRSSVEEFVDLDKIFFK
jgi:uncharacterized LabA/DUF88 family protein